MSYTEDAVKAKLSSLNETQESIVTVAQWIMFHRRYADRTAQLWFQRLKDSASPKRLNLVYLANEVVQQSKARKKDDFLVAFSPVIAEATGTAARGATNDVQQKLRRVVEVWRQRQIFDPRVQDEVEARIYELDKSQPKPTTKKPLLGGSLFSSDATSPAPTELQPLIPLQHALSKALLAAKPGLQKADAEHAALNDGAAPTPAPPVHAARLSALIKSLASAEDAVAETLRTRRALISGLEKLLESNKTELAAEEAQHATLTARKNATASKRHEVEDGIMRGLSPANTSALATLPPSLGVDADNETTTASGGAALNSHAADGEAFERPEMERFTPPPIESTTPPGLPISHDGASEEDGFERPEYEELTPPPLVTHVGVGPVRVGLDPRKRRVSNGVDGANGGGVSGGVVAYAPSVKRRRGGGVGNGHGGGVEGFAPGGDAMEGLDEEVVGMLG